MDNIHLDGTFSFGHLWVSKYGKKCHQSKNNCGLKVFHALHGVNKQANRSMLGNHGNLGFVWERGGAGA